MNSNNSPTIPAAATGSGYVAPSAHLLVPALLLALGCSNEPASSEPVTLVEVQGRVTKNGEPVSHASVTFSPVSETGTSARGITNRDGHYRLLHESEAPGAEAGQYKVVVREIDPRNLLRESAATQPSKPIEATVPPEGGSLDIELIGGR